MKITKKQLFFSAFLILFLFAGRPVHAQANCIDPFCTYAPPKLTGKGMAEAAREIMKAGTITFGLQREDKKANSKEMVDTFLKGDGLTFLDPILIARTIDNSNLKHLFSKSCISNFTHTLPSSPLPEDATGPFYVYRFHLGKTNNVEYTAVAVFGFAASYTVEGETYDQRIQAEHSSERIYILKAGTACDVLKQLTLGGSWVREAKRFIKQPYAPYLMGMGFADGRLFIYELENMNSGWATDPYPNYSFHFISPSLEGLNSDRSTYGSAGFVNFPSTFDPFAIINQQQAIP